MTSKISGSACSRDWANFWVAGIRRFYQSGCFRLQHVAYGVVAMLCAAPAHAEPAPAAQHQLLLAQSNLHRLHAGFLIRLVLIRKHESPVAGQVHEDELAVTRCDARMD